MTHVPLSVRQIVTPWICQVLDWRDKADATTPGCEARSIRFRTLHTRLASASRPPRTTRAKPSR